MRRVYLRITGQVQGVSFRYYARQRAHSFNLAGWVRNCADGSVEAVAEGDADAVQAFVDWAHRGPAMAHVERVEVREDTPTGEEETFRIAH